MVYSYNCTLFNSRNEPTTVTSYSRAESSESQSWNTEGRLKENSQSGVIYTKLKSQVSGYPWSTGPGVAHKGNSLILLEFYFLTLVLVIKVYIKTQQAVHLFLNFSEWRLYFNEMYQQNLHKGKKKKREKMSFSRQGKAFCDIKPRIHKRWIYSPI